MAARNNWKAIFLRFSESRLMRIVFWVAIVGLCLNLARALLLTGYKLYLGFALDASDALGFCLGLISVWCAWITYRTVLRREPGDAAQPEK